VASGDLAALADDADHVRVIFASGPISLAPDASRTEESPADKVLRSHRWNTNPRGTFIPAGFQVRENPVRQCPS